MQIAQKLSVSLDPAAFAFIDTYRKRTKAASRSQVVSEALHALAQREQDRALEAAYSQSAQDDIAINSEFDAVAADGMGDETW